MSKFKNHIRDNFTIVQNEIINDKDLTLEAKGLYLYFASKPTGWDFSLNGILSQNKLSRTKLIRIIKELEKSGWLKKTKRREGKKVLSNLYELMEKKQPQTSKTPSESNFETHKMRLTKCNSQNDTTSNTISSKKEKEILSQEEKVTSEEVTRERDFKKSFEEEQEQKKPTLLELKNILVSRAERGEKISFKNVGNGYAKETEFIIKNKLLYNTVSDKFVDKEEAIAIWNRIYQTYIQNNQNEQGRSHERDINNTLDNLAGKKRI